MDPRGSDGASPALRIRDVVSLIVDSLARPDPPSASARESPQSKAARTDLYHLACATTAFFYPATKKLWETLPTMKHLLRVLVDTTELQVGDDTETYSEEYVTLVSAHPSRSDAHFPDGCIPLRRRTVKNTPLTDTSATTRQASSISELTRGMCPHPHSPSSNLLCPPPP